MHAPDEYEPCRRTSAPRWTAPLSAFARLPDRPACLSEPMISPFSTLRMELVVTEKSPLLGLAVWAPMTLLTT